MSIPQIKEVSHDWKTTETVKTVFLWVWFLILAVVAGLAFHDGPVESLP